MKYMPQAPYATNPHRCSLSECKNSWNTVCPDGTSWVLALCSCVPAALQQLAEFHTVVYGGKACAGRTVGTAGDLEALRFCTSISGELGLVGLPASVTDFSPLAWISQINGEREFMFI